MQWHPFVEWKAIIRVINKVDDLYTRDKKLRRKQYKERTFCAICCWDRDHPLHQRSTF